MRVALVTGGGTGIGRSAALELNKIDFTVYVVGRREEELIKTSSLSTNNNHKIIPIKTDITIGSQVVALFDKIKSDPANGSGPFVTMANDLFSAIAYLLIALLIM